jgi:probable rRNA maturation factor
MPRLSLAVQIAEDVKDLLPSGMPSIAQFRKWVRSALQTDAEITLRIVGEDEGRMLNRSYRHKDYATNVLTFPLTEEPWLMGDIVLCAPVVMKEAKEQGKTPEAHFAHLTIHGVLHLQGHDHESEHPAELMESIETATM